MKINELKSYMVVSSETIQTSLVGLAELYVCMDELVRSPQTQQALSRYQNGTLVEDALVVSIGLLDLCDTIKELLMLMKENVQILQLSLRRNGGHSTIASKIVAYLSFRKKVQKSVTKSLGTLKHIGKKLDSFHFLDVDHHVSLVNKVLREVNGLTISVFKSLLLFVSLKTKSTNGVQLISKLVSKSPSTHAKSKTCISEMEIVDLALLSLHKNARNDEMKILDVQVTLRGLQNHDVSLERFEDGLDLLFRRLIQNRVSLLNIIAC